MLKNRKSIYSLIITGLLTTSVLFSCKCDANADKSVIEDISNVETTDLQSAGTASLVSITGTLDEYGNFIRSIGDMVDVSLPNGTEINIGSESTEANLVAKLSDDAYQVGKTDWITLDRTSFETGKAILTPDSEVQLKNLAAVLDAYPDSTIKIGGYTDNTGSVDANIKVSTERAATVVTKLSELGLDASRLKSEGFGPEFPICEANDTAECQAQNRRVDIRISAK
jgi:outer membrane protein OmpA-like peptidoglycan-associated protein